MTDSSPANNENTKYYPPPPLDGGGLRWGWTWYGPPHPCPLPSEDSVTIRRSPFDTLRACPEFIEGTNG